WVAAWGSEPSNYTFWQSGSTNVPGIQFNPTDVDHFNGTPDELNSLMGGESDMTPEQDQNLSFVKAVLDDIGQDLIPGYTNGVSGNAKKVADALVALLQSGGGGLPAHTHTLPDK